MMTLFLYGVLADNLTYVLGEIHKEQRACPKQVRASYGILGDSRGWLLSEFRKQFRTC